MENWKNYFAYGSLMDLNFVKELGVRFKNDRRGVLHNYTWSITVKYLEQKGFGFANIQPKINHKVEGVLMEVHIDDVELLDTYEGFPELYKKINATIVSPDMATVTAMVYVGVADCKSAEGLLLNDFQKSKIKNGLSLLSSDYAEAIENKMAKKKTINDGL